MPPKNNSRLSIVRLCFFLILVLWIFLLGAFSNFSLPKAEDAHLEHFLFLSPWGLWQHLVSAEDSAFRYAFYLPTAREGMQARHFMPVAYAGILVSGLFLIFNLRSRRD